MVQQSNRRLWSPPGRAFSEPPPEGDWIWLLTDRVFARELGDFTMVLNPIEDTALKLDVCPIFYISFRKSQVSRTILYHEV